MAYRALGPNAQAVTGAVRAVVADETAAVTVGCSGGPDSLALAAATAYVLDAFRVVIVDHGLQAGSDAVAEGVRQKLRAWQHTLRRQVKIEILLARVPHREAGEPGPMGEPRPTGEPAPMGGPEAAARSARYRIFTDALTASGGVLLLGHTLDDQAEQVLLGLARGSGPRSLAGMPAVRGPYRRPLLGLRRSQTEAACAEFGLEPWRDPHNSDPAFARARVRHRVLPVLEAELGPGVAEALARSAEQAGLDEELLGAQADFADTEVLPISLLAAEHPAIRRRMLRTWLMRRGGHDLSMANIVAVERLVTHWAGQRFVEVPGLQVGRSAAGLHVMPK